MDVTMNSAATIAVTRPRTVVGPDALFWPCDVPPIAAPKSALLPG